ncbi:S-layer homology domain-containing protein [Paenibacillus sp. GCM10012307]|uniref:S-layer homology domain-containing protein n=1 Tax=Paenibacillus roseus TaxID=2798579 RepID=A0A934J4E8_9BACL|nr:S-layer homology domain-containing protein [Paenibacillus roseus]MBJ6360127.1 S-layer homology domain-containing protein [Paenibacillus roseus]
MKHLKFKGIVSLLLAFLLAIPSLTAVSSTAYAAQVIPLAENQSVIETEVLFEDNFDSYSVGNLPAQAYDVSPDGFSVVEDETENGNQILLAKGNSGKLFKAGNWKNTSLTFDYKFNDQLEDNNNGLYASAYSNAPEDNESKVYFSLHPYSDNGANFSIQEYINGRYTRHDSGEKNFTIGQWYRAKAIWYEGMYYFKTWSTQEAEPEHWNLTSLTGSLENGGGLNLEFYGGNDDVSAAFDNIRVAAIENYSNEENHAIQAELFISPSGNDDNNGTKDQPFRTIEKAQQAVRSMNQNMTGDIIVYLRDGTFPVSQKITFKSEDSGTNDYRIVYKAYSGEKPVLSGAKKITGWTKQENDSGIWSAPVPDVSDTRQFYLNGKKGVIARGDVIKAEGWNRTDDPDMERHKLEEIFNSYQGTFSVYSQYITTAKYRNMANWRNKSQIEFVYDVAWSHSIVPLDDITVDPNGNGVIITMRNPVFRDVQIKDGAQVEDPNYIQNAYELLDEPGEWYFDRTSRVIYYMPRVGEDMTTAEAIVPTVEQLIVMEGTLDNPVHHITFENLTFEHTTPLRVSSEGYAEIQANILKDPAIDLHHTSYLKMPSGITLHAANHILFERNNFQFFGSGVIDIDKGSSDNIIRGSIFREIAGSGVQIGGFQLEDAHPNDDRKIVKDNLVTNNFFNKIGTDFKGSVAIFAGYTDGTTITHNEIYDTSYSGISVGWGWGYFDENGRTDREAKDLPRFDKPTIAKRNIIKNNYIHKVMQQLHDGAAIYTLSMMEGSSIEGNLIHSVPGWPGGLYLDEGTGGFVVRNNIIYDVSSPYHYNDIGMQGRQATNSIQTNYFGVTPGSANYPTHIASNAGIQEAYLSGMPPLITAEYDLTEANTIIAIPGKRFGDTKGTVTFTGGESSIVAQATDIVSWTPELIKVKVPSSATSGLVYITTADGVVSDKHFTLTIVPKTTLLFGETFDNLTPGPLPNELFSNSPSGFSIVEVDAGTGAKALQASGSSGKLFKDAKWKNSLLTFTFKFNDAMTRQYDGIYVSQQSEAPGANENKIYFSIHPNEANENVLVQQNINDYKRLATLKQKIEVGAWYSVKSAIIDNKLFLKVWSSQQQEPEQWQSISEVGGLSNGGGLNLELAAASGKTVLFDNLKVETWDRTPPVTKAIVDQEAHNGWFSSDTTVTLVSEDDLSGVASTEYRIIKNASEANESTTFKPYVEPFTLGEGIYEVVYRSIDVSGNQEPDKHLEVKVDKTAPEVSIKVQGVDLKNNQQITNQSQLNLTIHIQDQLSGIDKAQVKLDGTELELDQAISLTGKLGNHVLQIEASDVAGNTTTIEKKFTVRNASTGGGSSSGSGSGSDTNSPSKGKENNEEQTPKGSEGTVEHPVLKDVTNHWAKGYITKALEAGFVTGYTDSTFRPEQKVTRVEYVTMLGRALGLSSKQSQSIFVDQDKIPSWGAPYVAAAVEAGIIQGYEDHTFRSEQKIKRAEATVIAIRSIPSQPQSVSGTGFADDKQIPGWAKSYIEAAVSAGIVKGKDHNRFAPLENLTRAEAVVLIINLLNHNQNERPPVK